MSLTAGAAQIATVPITVMPAGLSISTQVILSTDAAGNSLAATSAVQTFTSSGVAQAVSHPITAPGAGTYYVGVAVKVAGNLVGIWTQPNIDVVAPYQPVSISGSIWLGTNSVYEGMGWTPIPNPEDIYQRITSGVTVIFSGPGGTFSAVSDSNGNFAINIPAGPNAAGTYNVTLTSAGYWNQKVMNNINWVWYSPFSSLVLVQGANWFTVLMEWVGYN